MNNKTEITLRIIKIKTKFCENSNKVFAEKLSITEQYASNICNGQKSTGKKLLEKILDTFPEVSRTWLYFGEGEMLTQHTSKPFSDSDNAMPTAAESADQHDSSTIADLRRENALLYEHIQLLKDFNQSLKEQLQLQKEKVSSQSDTTHPAHISQ